LVPLLQLLVKMLHVNPRVALLVQSHHAQHFLHRSPTARRLADPPIAQTRRPLIAQPVAPTPERSLRDPQHLRRFALRQLAPLTPLEQPLKTHLSYPLQHFRPAAHSPASLSSGSKTGQITRYKKPDRSRLTHTRRI
jgi:hypothetical protein